MKSNPFFVSYFYKKITMKNILVLTSFLFFFQNGYSCKCLIEYDLLYPLDLILEDNGMIAFEGQVVALEEDTIYNSGYETIHTIAYYKILNLYKGRVTSDTIVVHYYNSGSSCDTGSPAINTKSIIVEHKNSENNLVVGYCTFNKTYLGDNYMKALKIKKGVSYEKFLRYINEDYFETKSIFKQLTNPQKDGTFKKYTEYQEKQQLIVEGEVVNGQIKGVIKVYDKNGDLAFEIKK
jgi:hypothetical protein